MLSFVKYDYFYMDKNFIYTDDESTYEETVYELKWFKNNEQIAAILSKSLGRLFRKKKKGCL